MKQDAIWDHFQNEEGDSFIGAHSRLSFLIKKCSQGEKVLNIGVGSGSFEKMALERDIDIHSLDPSDRSIEAIKEKYQLGEKAKTGYSQSLPFNDDYFDVVVMSEVLEHLDNDTLEKTMQEVVRVIKPSGRYIGTVPAFENLVESFVVCPHCEEKFHRWGHLQSFDESKLTMLLQKQFKAQTVQCKYFISWKTLNWKGKILASMKWALCQLGQHGKDENLYFEAIK